MNFSERLSIYTGQNVEVFLANNFYTGELLSVGDGVFTVRVSDQSYYNPPNDVTIFQSNVEFVRILV
jgi:hypothetical protein